MSSQIEDITGFKSGYLTAVSLLGRFNRKTKWLCKCDCGNITTVEAGNLKNGNSRSCGCYIKIHPSNFKHGKCKSSEWVLLHNAKRRAKERELDFNLDLNDIVIPTKCPILNIPLVKAGTQLTGNSPSIDRIDSSKGYIKGNIHIISHRANTIKNNGTAEEHMAIAKYIQERT